MQRRGGADNRLQTIAVAAAVRALSRSCSSLGEQHAAGRLTRGELEVAKARLDAG